MTSSVMSLSQGVNVAGQTGKACLEDVAALLGHVGVELVVPGGEEAVGHVQPLSIQAATTGGRDSVTALSLTQNCERTCESGALWPSHESSDKDDCFGIILVT